ncbi:MAG: glycosyltransferase, partial [Friedmanniella sp.]
MAAPGPRLAVEYVVPLRWAAGTDPTEMTSYLHRLGGEVDVTVVDGSEPDVWEVHHRLWAQAVRHVRPEPWPGRNGKVAGVVTGVRLARHERVVIADDDVRWRREELERVVGLL